MVERESLDISGNFLFYSCRMEEERIGFQRDFQPFDCCCFLCSENAGNHIVETGSNSSHCRSCVSADRDARFFSYRNINQEEVINWNPFIALNIKTARR